jgi:hypothetical protein
VSPEKAIDRLQALGRLHSPVLQTQVARSLAAIGTDRCVAALNEMLADPSSQVRAAAVQGLGALGRSTSVVGLRAALADESRSVRFQAARSLVDLGDAGIAALLRNPAGDGADARRPRPRTVTRPAGGRPLERAEIICGAWRSGSSLFYSFALGCSTPRSASSASARPCASCTECPGELGAACKCR